MDFPDLSTLTLHGVIDQLTTFALAKMDLATLFGLFGGIFFVSALYMKTMARLRVANIVSNFFFLLYGFLAPAFPTFVMYVALLPINFFRLYQLRELIGRVKSATQGDMNMDWLKPFMKRRKYRKGTVLFRKGDRALEMFYTVSGKYLVSEIGVELPAGRLFGELGVLTPDSRRTQSVECIEDGEVLTVTYDKVLELYFQDPDFGFYFLKLTSDRLLQNIKRLEDTVEKQRKQLADLTQQR
jgi:cyclic nucleotide-binding protein